MHTEELLQQQPAAAPRIEAIPAGLPRSVCAPLKRGTERLARPLECRTPHQVLHKLVVVRHPLPAGQLALRELDGIHAAGHHGKGPGAVMGRSGAARAGVGVRVCGAHQRQRRGFETWHHAQAHRAQPSPHTQSAAWAVLPLAPLHTRRGQGGADTSLIHPLLQGSAPVVLEGEVHYELGGLVGVHPHHHAGPRQQPPRLLRV